MKTDSFDFRGVPELNDLGLPWEERRKEIKQLLTNKLYGGFNRDTVKMKAISIRKDKGSEIRKIRIVGEGGVYSFRYMLYFPKNLKTPYSTFLFLHTGSMMERPKFVSYLLERGYAVAYCTTDEIEKDNSDIFPSGLVNALVKTRTNTSVAAIGAWAFAMEQIISDLMEIQKINSKKIGVAGCSRCGKAALWCGANDERIYMTASLDSGCGGAAIDRGKRDETLYNMCRSFPHWLCELVEKETRDKQLLPFDQHYLLSLIAPRKLLVTSSTRDPYSDPYAEFLGIKYASGAYLNYDRSAIATWIWPPAGQLLMNDHLAYYLRDGDHGMTEEDWDVMDKFMQR